MASNGNTDKAIAPVKSEAAAKDSGTSGTEVAKSSAAGPAAAPAGYNRGEGQKPVTTAYKENWNAIFGKKTKKKR